MKKKLRADAPKMKKKAPGPVCPDHHEPMEYNPAEMLWQCPDELCPRVAYPHTEIGRGKPQILRGTFDLVVIEGTDNLYLRLMEYNVLFDISSLLREQVTVEYEEGNLRAPIKAILRVRNATLIQNNGQEVHVSYEGP